MEVHRYGPLAWLVEHDDPIGFTAGVRAASIDGVVDVVPAETTVLVACRRDAAALVGERLHAVEATGDETTGRRVTIPVRYDGDDLDGVAAAVGMSVEEVITAHLAPDYDVAFCGFSPGFAYLRGLDERLWLPRRAVPRTTVPAGSVAIAAHYSAVYPSPSPGGWHLLGRTTVEVWDASATDPALLTPGTTVRFERTS